MPVARRVDTIQQDDSTCPARRQTPRLIPICEVQPWLEQVGQGAGSWPGSCMDTAWRCGCACTSGFRCRARWRCGCRAALGCVDGRAPLPGFKQFARRVLPHVVNWPGQWSALSRWLTGVIPKCRPRDRWLTCHTAMLSRRLLSDNHWNCRSGLGSWWVAGSHAASASSSTPRFTASRNSSSGSWSSPSGTTGPQNRSCGWKRSTRCLRS